MTSTSFGQVTLADIKRCPFQVLTASHYREDGTCRCRNEQGELQALVITTEYDRRRYVVIDELDEFANVPSGPIRDPEGTPALGPDGPGTATRPPSVNDIREKREDVLGRFSFGARWLRRPGAVDEMYRTLSTWQVVKVERLPYEKVWGDGR